MSKTLSPSLRLGFIVAPRELVHPLRALKFLSDRHSSTLTQDVLADFIAEGHFERHLHRAKRSNHERRAALMESLKTEFGNAISIEGANAGLHVVVWLPNVAYEETDRLVAAAEKKGVGVYSIAPYFINAPKCAGLLLGFASLEAADIRRGIARLAESLGSASAI
jgi:GntR family transcriptional regulator/MocR family aminotransferase